MAVPVFAENYLLNGGQSSQIDYQMVQKVQPLSGTRNLILSYVVPESFNSPTYRQEITGLDFNFSPSPSKRNDKRDHRGNKVIEVTWKAPLVPVTTTISLTAMNSVKLQTLQTSASFPPTGLPAEAQAYLKATEQVPVGDGEIQAKARELTALAKTQLKRVGLALHKFNDDGQLWLELFEDDGGKPGKYLATSDIILLRQMKFILGYSWVDFDFSGSSVILSPGRYWVALGFTDSAIVNWFFTYGKPVGPQDGTRYKTMFDDTWGHSLAYEFNYRVMGLVSK